MKSLLLDALACQNSARPPVWLMRQAGRYMASYRALRQKYSFLEMCHEPELVAKVTLLPINQFGMDAAILFSDILVVAEALGLGLEFQDQVGPIIHRPIMSEADIDSLPRPDDLSSLEFVERGILNVKPHLNVPLIGFCGAPFTVASYLIEGRSSRDFKKTKQWMLNHPSSFKKLLELLSDWSVAYLNKQIAAGVDAIQIFDSWAYVLSNNHFREFALPYLKSILQRLKPVPVILFCKGSSVFAPDLAELCPSAISLDWNCDLKKVRTSLPASIAIQGNLDPSVLYGTKMTIEKEVKGLLDSMKGQKGYIFNLGHGIYPDVTEEAVQTLVDCVKKA